MTYRVSKYLIGLVSGKMSCNYLNDETLNEINLLLAADKYIAEINYSV